MREREKSRREEDEKKRIDTKKEILGAFQMKNGRMFDFQYDIFMLHVNSNQMIKALTRNKYWANKTLDLEAVAQLLVADQ